jgi:uncharacterized protein involved in type VI secretion and phage assembly
MENESYFGKYRGIVADIKDPLQLGRLRAHAPDIYGNQICGWAHPCLPFAGDKMGFMAIPPVGTPVWIECEGGDPDYPIWSGARWDEKKKLPPLPAGAQSDPGSVVMICTQGGHSILLDDAKNGGGITLQIGSAYITINSQGIEINNGKGASIKLSGDQVSINDGALEVK